MRQEEIEKCSHGVEGLCKLESITWDEVLSLFTKTHHHSFCLNFCPHPSPMCSNVIEKVYEQQANSQTRLHPHWEHDTNSGKEHSPVRGRTANHTLYHSTHLPFSRWQKYRDGEQTGCQCFWMRSRCGCHYRRVTGNTRESTVVEQFCLDLFLFVCFFGYLNMINWHRIKYTLYCQLPGLNITARKTRWRVYRNLPILLFYY